jgi:small nuclear ribonucleoprotein D3
MADSIPVKILLDAVGTQVYLELETGESYSGRLTNVEDNMNVQLQDATKTSRNGKSTSTLKSVYVRGSNVVLFQLPDALASSPAVQAAMAIPDSKSDARGGGNGFGGGRMGEKKPAGRKRDRDESS